jgi:predicted DNA-binding WGR domain protein
MNGVYLQKRDPAKRQARFYHILVLPTLFGPWAMVREWGRIGSPGTVRETWFDSEQEAREAGMRLQAQKMKRGYQRK